VDEPRTHYQISVTARQAVGLFIGLLLSLGLAFFFGLMAGLSGGERAHARAATPPVQSVAAAGAAEPLPAVETAVPTSASAGGSRADSAAGGSAVAPLGEPTAPPIVQTFEDGSAEEGAAAAGPVPPAAVKPTTASRSAAAAGRVWVQVASLSKRSEADAISVRLSKRGYHAQVVSDGGTKGRLRVRVGPYRTTEDARRAAEKLRKQEKIKSPWVVTEAR
jgi:cell division protein FtsN